MQFILIDLKEGSHIKIIIRFFTKFFISKDINIFIFHLSFYDFTVFRFLDHMISQLCRIIDTGSKQGSVGILRWLHDTDHFQVFPVFHQFFHIFIIIRFVFPDLVFTVIAVIIRSIDQFKGGSQNILITVCADIIRSIHIFILHKLFDHIVKFHGISESQCVQEKIADTSVRSHNYHTFVITFRPATCFYIILVFIQILLSRHLIKHICAHHRGHHTICTRRRTKPQRSKGFVRINLTNLISIFVQSKDLRCCAVTVFHGFCVFADFLFMIIQIFFQRFQVIGVHRGEHICDHLHNIDLIVVFLLRVFIICPHVHRHHGSQVKPGTLDLQWIFR